MSDSISYTRVPLTITRDDVDGQNIKYIENTNELFAVSRNGCVYSFSIKMGGKLIGANGPGGYRTASIKYVDKDKRINMYVHRLVAEAFIPNPTNRKQVAHINEDRKDNRVENLAWVSGKENCNMGNHNIKLANSIKEFYRNRSMFGRYPKRVAIMDKNDTILKIAPSIQSASNWIKNETGKDDNASSVQISKILQSVPGFKSVGGYRVREATEEEYREWTAKHMNTLLQDENIEISEVQLNKVSKIDGVKITNRRMNTETGEMEIEVNEFNKGDKVTNELY